MGIEIERKFLVRKIPLDICQRRIICQGYILNEAGRVVRIRTLEKEGQAGGTGFLTVKGRTRDNTRPEYEYEIPLNDARKMLDLVCEKPLIRKTRLWTLYEGQEWVIDCFAGENRGLVVAEIELRSPDQEVAVPPWAGPEVSRDPRYFNSNLIRHPYGSW